VKENVRIEALNEDFDDVSSTEGSFYQKASKEPYLNQRGQAAVTVEQAMQDLQSHRLRAIVFVWINVVFNFNSVFVGAMPFLIAIPKLVPVLTENGVQLENTEEACQLKPEKVVFDDAQNSSDHYHNLVTYL